MNFTTLEMTLMAITIALVYGLFRMLIRELVLRHEFIKSSDWFALKIREISESAEHEIIEEVQIRFPDFSLERAKQFVPSNIVNAYREWEVQKEKFQNNLERNGMQRLIQDDKTFMLSNFYR